MIAIDVIQNETTVLIESTTVSYTVLVQEQTDVLTREYALLAQESAAAALVSENNALESETNAKESELLAVASAQSAESDRVIVEAIREELEPYLQEARFDHVGFTTYYGKAPKDSLESQPVWRITRIIDNNGVPISATVENQKWDDRLTIIY
jgi:hypothetical protein